MVLSISDKKNAFFEVQRAAMHRAVGEHCPELLPLYKAYYSRPSVAVYMYIDEDGKQVIRIILIEEGARIGCVLGTFSFNITVYEDLYGQLAREFPSWFFKAQVDDLLPMIPPPPSGSDEDWQALYWEISRFNARHCELAERVGLVNHSMEVKGGVLLPDGAPAPLPNADGVMPFKDVPFLEFGGALIGRFTDSNVGQKFAPATRRVDSIMLLKRDHPAECLRLLITSANHSMDFFVRVMATHVVWAHCLRFDAKIKNAFEQLLQPDSHDAPEPDEARALRAEHKRQLALHENGLGFIPLTVRAPASHIH